MEGIPGNRSRASSKGNAHTYHLRWPEPPRSPHDEATGIYLLRIRTQREQLSLIRISADLWELTPLSRTFFRIPQDNQRGTLKRFYGLQKSASLLFEGAAALG